MRMEDADEDDEVITCHPPLTFPMAFVEDSLSIPGAALSSLQTAESSFTFTPNPTPNCPADPTLHYILDINKYIPAGCLRIQRSDSAITGAVWNLCSSWHAFAHPRDYYNARGGPFLPNNIQELLLNSPILHPYRALHNAGWIRMEFKIKDQHLGQIRIYILPDDVGRGNLDRQQSSLRKAMQLLIAQMDISKATWNGEWSEITSVSHVDSSLNGKPKDDVSLFYLFNTLPSPNPDPEIVVDRYARDAMYKILDSNIEGLSTKMHLYQRRSAALMLQRETQPSQIIDPRLRPIVDQKDATWYCNLDAGSCLREPRTYEAAKGGILAETMGLGKTLICLSLILATRELSSQIPVEYSVGTVPIRPKTGSLKDMAAATIARTGTPWKNHFAAMQAEGYDFSQCLQTIRKHAGHYYLPSPAPRRESRNPVVIPPRKIWLSTATIVVVPSNLVQQWRHEIKKHTVGLKVLVMNSNKAKLPPAQELAEFDIILFSKQRFEKEAKDGSDEQGRRFTTTNSVCRCPYIGSTRLRDCTCFREEDTYRSSLKDLHFKRLITDEGHNFGNASSSSKTEAITVVDFLQLSSRWIVSGTPTAGLYGAEVALSHSEGSSMSHTPLESNEDESTRIFTIDATKWDIPGSLDVVSMATIEEQKENAFYLQERKDLEKLGNIATNYLKARPWANTYDSNDVAFWSQHVMQPRHGSKSHGNMDCLKSTLDGMIIRHRPEDVSLEVTLPPLHQTVVCLDGSYQDKLSLNMFSLMIVSNAVTSERKDHDYLFHPRQRKNLQLLVSNLRQASFFWCGFTKSNVQDAIDNAKKFLEKKDVPISIEDEILLEEAIAVGQTILANNISQEISRWHEMPMYVQNEWSEAIRNAWALDGYRSNPTLIGAGIVYDMHKFVSKQLWKEDPMDGLIEEGKRILRAAISPQSPQSNRPRKISTKDPKPAKKATEQTPPALAGGVSVGDGSTPKKRSVRPDNRVRALAEPVSDTVVTRGTETHLDEQDAIALKSALKKSIKVAGTVDPSSPLASTAIVSTSSAKLSYLLDRIIAYQSTEKIIVFYEADNVAWYIAQALEVLGIEYLIYAKTLTTDRRSTYVVTFNQTEKFRVLLMDVSQAAFGLDMSSASRVYFINPVFSPQVEAQAVKRAHRIGQTKPVFVETLVLKDSIEEVILERRKELSTEEHTKCKTILDDQTMFDWIRNVRFLPLSSDVPKPEQMAKLETPQLVFDKGTTRIGERGPNAGLILDSLSAEGKGKKRPQASFADDLVTVAGETQLNKRLAFSIPESDGYIEPTSSDDEQTQREQGPEDAARQWLRIEKRKSESFEGKGNTISNSMLMNAAGLDPADNFFRPRQSPSFAQNLDTDIANLQFSPMPLQPSNWLSSLQLSHTWNSGSDFVPATSGNTGFSSSIPPYITSSQLGLASSLHPPTGRDPNLPTRRTVTSACIICRRRKLKCDRLEPCTPCTTSMRDCVYGDPISQRSLASFAKRNPLASSATQFSISSSSNTSSISVEDSNEIEYSTPRPRTKRTPAQVLGVKMPSGVFKIPPRKYTSRSSSTSEASTPSPSSTHTTNSSLTMTADGNLWSPTKAQRARLDGKGTKSLLVKLKIGRAASQVGEIEENSDAWRAEMMSNGAKIGKRGWERVDAGLSEPQAKKAKGSEKGSGHKNDEGDHALVSGGV